MTDEELAELLGDLESDRVERKASGTDKKKIQQAICAFANDMPSHSKPGVLFVGVADNGSCANLTVDDKLLLGLSQLRSTGNILPLPSLTVQKRTINGCTLVAIVVEPSALPPVRFNGRTWIRIGPQRATATIEQEKRLTERRINGNQPWDTQQLGTAGIDDLNLDLFRSGYLPTAIDNETLATNGRTIEQQLRSLRFLGSDDRTPTVTGLLAVGVSPADFLPGAYLQFLRIDGDDLSAPIADQQDIHGPLIQVITEIDVLLRANIRIATDIVSSSREIKKPDYPLGTLQQLTRNAIMHRNYESSYAPTRIYWFRNRIEIHSPGGPFGAVTIDNFGEPGITDYRNPTVAEVMRNLGFVQRFGVGIATARKELIANDNPPLELTVEATHVLAIVRKAK